MKLYEKLKEIQKDIKAPKNLWSNYGEYHYRNAESILEGLKPLEAKYGVVLILSDDIVQMGDRFYVKATARLYDTETDSQPIEVTAWAREPASKKSFDDSQVTGASSSYARKYALGGMFLLDDVKDADSDEAHGDEKITAGMVAKLNRELESVDVTEDQVLSLFKGVKSIEELTVAEYNKVIKKIDATRKARSAA